MKAEQFGKEHFLDELAEIALQKADKLLAEPVLLLGHIETADLECLGFKDKAEHNALFEEALRHIRQRGKQPDDLQGLRNWLDKDGTKHGLVEFARGVKTPITFPDHHIVGKHWGGHVYVCADERATMQVYLCSDYDPRYDYALECVSGPKDRREVSPRAIHATYWPAQDRGDHWFIPQWGAKVPKPKSACT